MSNDWEDLEVPEQQEPEAYDLSVVDQDQDVISQTDTVVSEAMRRIEQANLYQTILKHSLFAEGSARPEIIEQVQRELMEFALGRLEALLGMGSTAPATSRGPVKVELPFDDEQVDALKAIANRALKRNLETPQPQLNTVTQPAAAPAPMPIPIPVPAVNPVKAAATARTAPRPAARTAAPAKPAAPATATKPKRRRSGNVSAVTDDEGKVIVDKDYSQAKGQGNHPKPLPMPTPTQMNMQAAMAVDGNLRTIKTKLSESGAGRAASQLSAALAAVGTRPDTGE